MGLPRVRAHWVRPELVVDVTFIEQVFFPADGITKGEVAEPYRLVAPLMVPHIARRPLTLERFHRGIGEKVHPARYRPQRVPCDVCGPLRPARPGRRAGVGAMHVG